VTRYALGTHLFFCHPRARQWSEQMIRKSLLLIVTAVLLAACGDESSHYAVSDEHCQPDRLKTLPSNANRDTLVEKCMPRQSP